MISNALKWKAKPESRGWKKRKKTAIGTDRGRARVAKTEPMISSRVIEDRLKTPVSAVTTREHVNRPKENSRTILCTDESYIVPFFLGSKGPQAVCQSTTKHWIEASAKHGGGGASIMIWGFSSYLVGPMYRTQGITHQFAHVKTLQEITSSHAKEETPSKWVFQQDHDLKNTSERAAYSFPDQ